MGIKGTVRDGALIAGALAVGVTGAAAADKLLTGRDIEDGSLAKRELSKKAQNALKGQTGEQGEQGIQGVAGTPGTPGPPGNPAPGGSLLSTGIDTLNSTGLPEFVAPGTDIRSLFEPAAQTEIPPTPTGGFEVRGLAVRSFDSKGTARGGLIVTLRVNGADTALACTTPEVAPDLGHCVDVGSVTVTPGQRLSLRLFNGNSGKFILDGQVSLSLLPAG